MTQAWSLRETDLFQFQRKLDRIDEARVNGNFLDANSQPADLHAQRVPPPHFIPYVRNYLKTNCLTDITLPHPAQLCLYLCPPYRFRTSLRSPFTNL